MKRNAILRMWGLLDRRERRHALLVLGIMIVAAFASAGMVGSVFPFLAVLSNPERIAETPALAAVFDFLGLERTYDFILVLGLASIAVIVAANAILILNAYAIARFSAMQSYGLSRRLLEIYLSQPYEFFLDRHSGDLGTNILSETTQVVTRFLRPLAECIASTLCIIAVAALLLVVNPLVTLVAFALLGGSYLVIFRLVRLRARREGRRRAHANEARFRIASESLGAIKDTKLLGREAVAIDRFSQPAYDVADAEMLINVYGQVPRFGIYAIAFGGMIGLCLLLVEPGRLEGGNALAEILPLLGLFGMAGQRLMPELQKAYNSLTMLQFGAAAVDRVHADIAALGHAGRPPRQAPRPLRLRRQFALEGVCYRYPNAERPGLADVSLGIEAGERIGVVGSTGAGKTTLADVVLGLLQPSAGRLLVDGTPVTPDRMRAWQQSVGYVPQDIFLTDGSVAENIALGLPPGEIDHDAVRAAARVAQLHDFVTAELPQGYETRVGERGVRLSGGQRQRIGIARALYHEADLIVFDEATSALDTLTERDVMQAIETLPGDKTVILIAHRLSTVRRCDRIVVLERGRIVGFDSWEALMRGNENFRRMAEVA